jgi:hypothetical protein
MADFFVEVGKEGPGPLISSIEEKEVWRALL